MLKNQINNRCDPNAYKLWRAVNQIKKKNPNATFNGEQLYQLCNFVNGRPFDRNILRPFIAKPQKNNIPIPTPTPTPTPS